MLGENLDKAEEIFYNGVSTKTFTVVSRTRLIVKIPNSQVGRPLKSLRVESTLQVLGPDAVLSLSVDRVSKIDGMERLIQSYLIILLSTPGSDLFEPGSGGGVQALVGRSSKGNGKGVAADLTLAVERAKSELLKLQSKDRRIPPNERLLSTSLVSLNFNEQATTISAVIEVTNALGASAQVTVGR